MITNATNKIVQSFQKVLFPDMCLVCKEFIDPKNKASFNELIKMDREKALINVIEESLCPECIKYFQPVLPPYCTHCGGMFKSRSGENHLCHNCLTRKSNINRIRSVGIYESSLLELIHKFKYNQKVQLADTLGKLLFLLYMDLVSERAVDLIIPVPLHPSRLRKRGFNQAQLVLKNWFKYFDSSNPHPSIEREALVRTKRTKTQIGLTEKERKKNLKNAFNARDFVKNRRILLVDDVYTTGATVESCGQVLLKEGAESVDVLTIARTGTFIK